jgi:TetR/AcrR family transcriptional regulator
VPKETFFNLPAEKRQLFLDVAIAEFAANDYKNASVSNIVARAGIAKGSFYQYFDDKRALYFYLLQLGAEEKKRFLAEAQPPDPNMKLFDYLHWLVHQGARFDLSRPGLAQVAYRALITDRPFGDEAFGQMVQMAREFYRGLVRRGIAEGSIDVNIDVDLAVYVFGSLFNNFGRHIMERQEVSPEALSDGSVDIRTLDFEGLTAQLIDILAHGLAPRKPA